MIAYAITLINHKIHELVNIMKPDSWIMEESIVSGKMLKGSYQTFVKYFAMRSLLIIPMITLKTL